MDWIKALLTKHTKEDGTVDQEAFEKEVGIEFAKNAVPKADFNAKVEELKTANTTLETLKNENKDVETLQKTITQHEETIKDLQAKEASAAKSHAIEKALASAKATDIEYLAYKLGDVELEEDGTIKDIDNKIKDLQTNHPTFFEEKEPADPNQQQGPAGFTHVPNPLKDGKVTDPDLTAQFTSAFTSDLPAAPNQ